MYMEHRSVSIYLTNSLESSIFECTLPMNIFTTLKIVSVDFLLFFRANVLIFAIEIDTGPNQ